MAMPDEGTGLEGGDAVDAGVADAIEFESRLTPMGITQVMTAGTLTNPSVITVLCSGPVLLLVGALTRSQLVLQWGTSFLLTLPAVPLISFVIAWVNAHRKAAQALYEPLGVRADTGGLTLTAGGETRQAEWTDFLRWRRVFGSHLLYNTQRTFLVLRTEGLGADTTDAFEALLRANISQGPRR
jgi:hypothetical protein